jgi:hypothetical protein
MADSVEADHPPLMHAQVSALRDYAQAHGEMWKEQLRTEWLNATAPPLLQHLRNTHGLLWLKQVEVPL